MEGKKYKLLENDTVVFRGKTLYRIKALRDFSNVMKGNIGGYIENEDNLSHEGDCWVYNSARVLDNAKVYGNARVYGNASVYDYAEISGDAIIFDNAKVYGNAKIIDKAVVYGYAMVVDNAEVSGVSRVFGSALIGENARLNNSDIHDHASIFGCAEIHRCRIGGTAGISSDAVIESKSDYYSMSISGCNEKEITFFKCKDGRIKVNGIA